jgi:hypothetical protein
MRLRDYVIEKLNNQSLFEIKMCCINYPIVLLYICGLIYLNGEMMAKGSLFWTGE